MPAAVHDQTSCLGAPGRQGQLCLMEHCVVSSPHSGRGSHHHEASGSRVSTEALEDPLE